MKKITTILIIVTLFLGCKKFPEDPFISLRTAKDRLSGTWKISYIKQNGIDVTPSFNTNTLNISNVRVSFNFVGGSSGAREILDYVALYIKGPDELGFSKFILDITSFSSTKSTITFQSWDNNTVLTSVLGYVCEIDRLYNNILILKNNNYEIKFIQ
ncbi:MAG: hypothetical protein JSU07_03205 [Bacteroidetes bacterium]|nr:hypothetical protein [Bacteroidota bacterium]